MTKQLINEYINQTISLLKQGELGEATKTIELALAYKQDQQDLYFTQSLCMYAVEDLEGTFKCLKKELELFPTNTQAKNFLDSISSEVSSFPVLKTKPDKVIEKIAILGNCQVHAIADLLSILIPDVNVTGVSVSTESPSGFDFKSYDHVFMYKWGDSFNELAYEKCKNYKNVTFIPFIIFSGYHPDCSYIYDSSNVAVSSAIGDYHSLIVYSSYLNRLSPQECASLFRPDFYKKLGYCNEIHNSKQILAANLAEFGLDAEYLVSKWLMQGPFMYSFNHPKQFVLMDLAKSICRKANLPVRSNLPEHELCSYSLIDAPIFPIYPGIIPGESTGEIYFKKEKSKLDKSHSASILLTLEEFIEGSYKNYSASPFGSLKVSAYNQERLEKISQEISSYFTKSTQQNFKHPYKDLADTNYWSKSISKIKMEEVDHVVKFPTLIGPETKVATAGSCFAQHVARALMKSGLNYYVPETGPEDLGFGLFSARFGNIYTAKQLLQLFDRAYGLFKPIETHWMDKEDKYIDPYRPNIGQRFESFEELEVDRAKHLSAVCEMFENLDVFVFTLGLTESWLNVRDGAVYPVAPGVISKNIDQNQYQFKNFTYDEVVADLTDFLGKLRSVNKTAKMILTVSPVPLIATYEDRHVLSSTTLSKSILRSAADTISNNFSFVEYYPSYEIITGNFNKGEYFAEDLRGVLDKGVNHVMRLVIEHCTTLGTQSSSLQNEPEINKADLELAKKRHEELTEVLCDENLLIE
ncbi:MAG: GSCFA domain-containing protein [Bdellovibrionota bacterium]